jgi:hypothetical protein
MALKDVQTGIRQAAAAQQFDSDKTEALIQPNKTHHFEERLKNGQAYRG